MGFLKTGRGRDALFPTLSLLHPGRGLVCGSLHELTWFYFAIRESTVPEGIRKSRIRMFLQVLSPCALIVSCAVW